MFFDDDYDKDISYSRCYLAFASCGAKSSTATLCGWTSAADERFPELTSCSGFDPSSSIIVSRRPGVAGVSSYYYIADWITAESATSTGAGTGGLSNTGSLL